MLCSSDQQMHMFQESWQKYLHLFSQSTQELSCNIPIVQCFTNWDKGYEIGNNAFTDIILLKILALKFKTLISKLLSNSKKGKRKRLIYSYISKHFKYDIKVVTHYMKMRQVYLYIFLQAYLRNCIYRVDNFQRDQCFKLNARDC